MQGYLFAPVNELLITEVSIALFFKGLRQMQVKWTEEASYLLHTVCKSNLASRVPRLFVQRMGARRESPLAQSRTMGRLSAILSLKPLASSSSRRISLMPKQTRKHMARTTGVCGITGSPSSVTV